MKKKTKLTSYLGGGVAAITASSAHGEIITIDLTSFGITGTNGGVASGALGTIPNFPFSGAGGMKLYNGALSDRFWGLDGDDGLVFAAGSAYASPTNFSSGATIDGTSTFWGSQYYPTFKYSYETLDISPAFGAGSYMGFETADGKYGWLEVTWDPTTEDFEILSGAYESTAGVAILAGDTVGTGGGGGGGGVSAIPETSSVLGLAGLVAGSAFLRRRKAA